MFKKSCKNGFIDLVRTQKDAVKKRVGDLTKSRDIFFFYNFSGRSWSRVESQSPGQNPRKPSDNPFAATILSGK